MNLIMHYESNYVLKLMPRQNSIHAQVQICPCLPLSLLIVVDSSNPTCGEVLGTQRTCTTAYHHTTIDIEFFHLQLKTSRKCYSHPEHWADFLPFVM